MIGRVIVKFGDLIIFWNCVKSIENYVLKYNVLDYKDKIGIYGVYIFIIMKFF